MEDLYIEILGVIAGVCTTTAFIPQIIKIMKTKHVKDISLYMYIIFTIGVALWLTYGILLGKFSVILANSVSLVLSIYVMVARIIYGKVDDQ